MMDPLNGSMAQIQLKRILNIPIEHNWHEIRIACIWGPAKNKVHFSKTLLVSHKMDRAHPRIIPANHTSLNKQLTSTPCTQQISEPFEQPFMFCFDFTQKVYISRNSRDGIRLISDVDVDTTSMNPYQPLPFHILSFARVTLTRRSLQDWSRF